MTHQRFHSTVVSARTVLLTALLLAGPALAGCVSPDAGGGSGSAAVPSTSGDGEQTPRTSPDAAALAAYGASAEPATVWANDSFQAHEPVGGSFPVELVFGFNGDGPHQMDEDFHDVTEHIPKGIPTNITATLTYPDEQAAMNLFVTTGEDVLFHGFDNTEGSDTARMWTTLSRFKDASVEVVVNSNQPGQAAETPYTLQVNITPAATTVPAAVATAVDVPEDASDLRIEPVDEETALTVRGWAPDDTYHGSRSAEPGAPIEAPVGEAGEHVILVSAPARVEVLGSDGAPAPGGTEMRSLEWTFEPATRTGLDPVTGTANVEMTTDRTPLSAWIQVASGDGGSQPGSPLMGAQATMDSPEGTVLEASPACGPFCTAVLTRLDGGWDVGVLAPLNQTDLVHGTYEGEVQADTPTANLEVRAGWLHYER